MLTDRSRPPFPRHAVLRRVGGRRRRQPWVHLVKPESARCGVAAPGPAVRLRTVSVAAARRCGASNQVRTARCASAWPGSSCPCSAAACDRCPRSAPGLQVAGEALDVGTAGIEQADSALVTPAGVLAQVQRIRVASHLPDPAETRKAGPAAGPKRQCFTTPRIRLGDHARSRLRT